VHAEAQIALRDAVALVGLDELLDDRAALGTRVEAALAASFEPIGLAIVDATLQDIVVHGDLKRAYATSRRRARRARRAWSAPAARPLHCERSPTPRGSCRSTRGSTASSHSASHAPPRKGRRTRSYSASTNRAARSEGNRRAASDGNRCARRHSRALRTLHACCTRVDRRLKDFSAPKRMFL